MAGGNQIQFGVGFNVNESGLDKLKQSLKEIQSMTTKDFSLASGLKGQEAIKQLAAIKQSAAQVQTALARAFNPTLGTTNIAKFNQEMQKLNVPQIAAQFNQLGATGQAAFLNLAKQSLSLNTPLKQNVGWLTKMGETLANNIKWHIASSAINAFTGSISNAVNYVKALDASLTDIRIVTGQSRDEMAEFAMQANDAAQSLGRQTKEYTNAALAYYQQGLSAQEVQQRTEATLKAQNITGAGTEMTDYLTAVWNGYKATNDEIELYVDKLALVADSSASNLAELATGMSKVAATANNMGVSIDQLTAQLATIIATTRQAPETVGNALKTIYARMNDIKAGTDEAEISLGNYTKKMATLGINVLDSNGRLRDTGEVMEEIGAKWQNMTNEQQKYLAQTMAGQRQMNNLISLFDNWETYSEMLNTSLNAQGTLNEKNARYMESLGAHINQFKTAMEGLQDSLIDEDSIIGLYDAGTKLVHLGESFINSIGGMQGVLIGLGALGTNVFKNQIAESILVAINNLRRYKEEAQAVAARQDIIKMFDPSQFGGLNNPAFETAIGHLQRMAMTADSYRSVMTSANQEALNGLLNQQAEIDQVILKYQELTNIAIEYGNQGVVFSQQYGNEDLGFGTFNFQNIFSEFDIMQGKIQVNEDEIKNLQTAVAYAQEEYTYFGDKAGSLVKLTRAHQTTRLEIEKQRDKIAELELEYERYQNAAKTNPAVAAQQEQRRKQLDQERAELQKLEEEYSRVQIRLKDFITEMQAAADSEQGFGKNTTEIQNLLQQLEKPGANVVQILIQLYNVLKNGGEECQRAAEGLRKMMPALEGAAQGSEHLKSNFEQFIAVLKDQQFAQSLTSMLRGVSSLAMGLQSLVSVQKTYKEMQEGNITASEGWLRIIMGLSMALPMVGSGMKNLIGGMAGVGKTIGYLITNSSLASAGLQSLGAAAVASNVGFAGLMAQLGLAVPIILAVIAVVWLLVKAIQGIHNWLNRGTKAFEAQNKAFEESKRKTEELTSAYKELKSTIEDYQDARNAIDNLVQGTEEWKEAIQQANTAAEKLLELWPELAGKVHIDSNGNITISDVDLHEAEQSAQKQAILSAADTVQQSINTSRTNVGKKANEISASNLDEIANFGRRVAAIEGLSEKIQIQWDLIWQEAINQIGGHTPHTTDEVNTVNEYIRENLDANLSDFDILLLRQYGDRLIPVVQAASEEITALNGFQQQLAIKFLPLLNNIDTTHQGVIAAMMAAKVNLEAIDPQTGQIDFAKLEQIVDNIDNYVKQADILFKDTDPVIENAIIEAINNQQIDTSNLTKKQREIVIDFLKKHFEALGLAFDIDALDQISETQQNALFEQISKNLEKNIQNIYSELIANADDISPATAKNVGAILTNAFIEGGTEGTREVAKLLQDLPKENLEEILYMLSSGMNFDDMITSLELSGINTESFTDKLHQLILLLGSDETASAFGTITSSFKEVSDIIDDLHAGDAIKAEDYDKIEAYLGTDLAQELFEVNNANEYQLITTAEHLKEVVESIEMDQLQKGLQQTNAEIEKLMSLPDINFDTQITGRVKNHQIELSGDNLELAQNRAEYAASTGGAGQLSAAHARQISEDLQNGNLISQEDLNLLNQAADQWANIDTIIQSTKQDVENFNSALQNLGHNIDEDVNIDDLEKMSQYLAEYGNELLNISDDLKNNHKAALVIAEDMLRAEHAAKEVTDHLEDWKTAFKNARKGTSEYVDAIEDADNAYKDLLNLSNDTHLSEEFLTSAENLQDMEKAINGDVEAYERLADAAQQDIISQGLENIIKLNPELDEEALANLSDNLMQHINDIENSIDGIEIGADLQDEDFIAELDNLINAAGLTADQATALLASMGIDATVVEGEPTETQSTQSAQAYTGPTYSTESIPFGGPFGGGTFTYPKLTSQGTWEPITSSNTDSSPRPFALHVTSAKKGVGSGGNINRAKAASGGGGGGKKGGGGGGGGKQPQKKTTKPFKAKIDPYHDVNIKIGDVQEGLDKLQKDRDKLIGKDAVNNLAQQINLLEKEKELLREKAAIAKDELQKHAEEIAQYGAIVDANGNILNYKELLEAKQKQINEAIEIANGLEGEEQEAYLKYVDDLKEQYKELEEGIKDLDDTKQLLDDLGLDYQDLINEQIEKAIEAFDLEINVKLDLQDAEKEFNEFRKKVIDKVQDDQHGALAEATARNYSQYYNIDEKGNVGGLIPDLRKHATQIQKEIEIITNGGFSQIYGDNLAAAAEDLKKYNDELMKGLEEAQEIIDETHDHLLDAIEAMNEAFDTQQENLDKIDDLLQHDMEILQLIHGEENYDEMGVLWEQQIAQDNKRLQALQAEQAYWEQKLQEYEEGTDEWKEAMEHWQDAFEKTNDAMLNAVKNLQSQWENSINKILSKLKNTTYGGNMTAALEDWDKMNWHSDKYLDSLERATGLLDLQNEYQQAINKTTDPKLQAQMAALEEKTLNTLADKEHLREIDLQLAKQQLEVLQAQAALEDAQQAKTKLRLRRDSQGNYTYQYVADEDDIAAKTQDYIKSLAEYRAMSQQALRDDLDEMNSYIQEYYDKMYEAQMKYGDDTQALMEEQNRLYELYMGPDGYITLLATACQEDQRAEQLATYTQASGLNALIAKDTFEKFLGPDESVKSAILELVKVGDDQIEHITKSAENGVGSIEGMITNFTHDVGIKAFDDISAAAVNALTGPEGLAPQWKSALMDIANHYEDEFVPAVLDAMWDLQVANQTYVDGLSVMQTAAKRTTEQMAIGLAADTYYTNSLNKATDTLLKTQDAELERAEKVYDSLKKNEKAFQDQSKAAIDAANALFLYWLALNGQTASGLPYSVNGSTDVKIDPPEITSNQPSYTPSYSNNSGSNNNTSGSGGGKGGNTPKSPMTDGGEFSSSSSTWRANGKSVSRYATGGYTGEWNEEPRLALLDQKELVLNADDTKNMLDAVNIVRTITDKVSAITNAAAANISSGGLLDLLTTAKEQILQNVVINADFPAVQDAAQIKQAFNELVNLASQRASANRRAN